MRREVVFDAAAVGGGHRANYGCLDEVVIECPVRTCRRVDDKQHAVLIGAVGPRAVEVRHARRDFPRRASRAECDLTHLPRPEGLPDPLQLQVGPVVQIDPVLERVLDRRQLTARSVEADRAIRQLEPPAVDVIAPELPGSKHRVRELRFGEQFVRGAVGHLELRKG